MAGSVGRSHWRDALGLLGIGIALLTFDVGARTFATNDETRFPMLARDILVRGEWWLPRLNGVPHLNKPPLHAWLIALAAWPLGTVTDSSATVPSIVAALAVVLTTYWIALRLFDLQVARAAALIVVTTAGVFGLARVPMPDMTLCAALTGSMAALAAAEFGRWRHRYLTFYAVVATGFWIKGPAVVLALGVAIAYALATYGWEGWARLWSWPGLALLVVLPLPWWLMSSLAGSESFGRDVVLNDFLLWYLPTGQATWRHVIDPIVQAATILLPWVVVLPLAIRWALSTGDPARRASVQFLMIWMLVMAGLLAIGHEQRWRYYLPLCPPVAILVAAWYGELPLRRRPAWFLAGWSAVAVVLTIGQGYARARHNAVTDLSAVTPVLRSAAAPIYAVDVPDLVLTYYSGRPVTALRDYRSLDSLTRGTAPYYLVAADRFVPPGGFIGLTRLGGGVINNRRFSVFVSTNRGP